MVMMRKFTPDDLSLQRDLYASNQVNDIEKPPYDGTLTINGSGELTQQQVNDAIDAFGTDYDNQILHTLYIGEFFESLGISAVSDTSLTSIMFHP
jgi:hypothetical protein